MKKITESEIALFRQAVKGIKPIKYKKMEIEKPKSCVKKIVSVEEVCFEPPPFLEKIASVNAEEVLSFCRPGVQHKIFKKLKKGNFEIEAMADFHGMTVEEAWKAFQVFLDSSFFKHHRCVCIVHGKGGRGGELPILKNKINMWLRGTKGVLAFYSAMKKGGAGAVNVLLRKTKGVYELY